MSAIQDANDKSDVIASRSLIASVPNQPRVFPRRNSGLLTWGFGMTLYAAAIASFGRTAQLVVTWLLHVPGDPLAPAWYLLLEGIVGLFAMSLMPETAPMKTRRHLTVQKLAGW